MADRKNGTKTGGRNDDGTFSAGNAGKPKGARHRTTRAIEALLEGQAEELTKKAVEMALEGDTTALRLCLERIAPARKDTPVTFELPEIKSASDASSAAQSIIKAVSIGNVTPLEAATIMGLLAEYRRTLEAVEFDQRLAVLERNL